jgi:site-specific DNA recombinase
MRAAIYARIACATEERILSQSATLRSYAAKNGAEVVEEFTDDGYSGLRLDRPGLERMRRLAAQGGFDVLLTSGPDRLARKHELLAVILEELKGLGIKTVFVDDGGDNVIADNPLGPGRAGRWPELEQAKVSDSEKSVVLALGQETAR